MRGIYENYTSEQVKSIFEWYLKYKNQVGGLLAKPIENESENVVASNISGLNKEIHKLMHLHTESDKDTMVPYKGLVFSGMANIPAETFTIKTYKEGTLIDEATFNTKSLTYDKAVNAYLEGNVKEDGTNSEKPSFANLKTNSSKSLNLKPFDSMDWESFSGASEFEGGKTDEEKQPLIGDIEVLVNGQKMELMLIADQNGFQVAYADGEDGIAIPTLLTTQKYAKDYLQEIYNSGELHEFLTENSNDGDVFTPIAPNVAQAEQKSSLADLPEYKGEPDFPIPFLEKTIQEFKETIVDPKTGEFTPNKLKKKLNEFRQDIGISKEQIQKILKWGEEWEKWAYTATESELFPSAKPEKTELDWEDDLAHTGKIYEDYPNGDLPSAAMVNVWHNGLPKKAYIVVHHGGTTITLDNQQYTVQAGSMGESVADSKKGLADQISGKYNDIVSDLAEYEDVDLSFVDPAKTKSESAAKQEKPLDIESFWPESLKFMSPYEIDYVKQSIKDAIAAGNNSNTWLNKFEMYGKKAEIAYSPESQKELKKVFDEEAKKIQGTNRLKIADAEDYFQKAIKNDANYGWKEIVDINSDWPEQLVNALFQYGQTTQNKPEFFSLPQTLTVGNRTYTAYTPNKGGDIFILYGDYNDSGRAMNYDWTGAAQFKTANRTTEEIVAELAEWLKGEVDYLDPQI
jgi:hypothetical protein